MELSLEIITESMKRFQGALLLADDQPFSFRRIKLLSEEDFQNLAEDTLYVGLPKTLRKLPRSDFRGHCFVFPAKQSAVERYKGYINAIVFNEATPISEVINHLMELFQRIQVLELKMQIAIRSANPYLSLMEVAREMFPNSVMIIVDSAYNIIAASHDSTNKNSDVDGLLRQGFYDKSYLQKMLAYGYFDQGDRYLKPQVSHRPNIAGVPMLIRSFHNSGIFYSFVTCYFMEDPPDLLDQYLFSVFTEQLDVFFEESGFYQNAIPKKQQMLEDLLSNDHLSPDLIQERCRELGVPAFGDFRLGYIEYENGTPIKLEHMATQLRTWCKVKHYGIFLYRKSVIILFKDWHSYSDVDREAFLHNWSDMLRLLSSSRARIGVSLLFPAMGNIHAAYLQARSALQLGSRMHPNRRQYPYSEYFVYDMLETYQTKIPLDTVYTQYLDKLFLNTGGESSNLLLLYHFLNSERNISATAPKVHMHRNSVIYRLQKINDTLHLNLDDPETRLRLTLSYKILEYLGKLPPDFWRDKAGQGDQLAQYQENGVLPE